MLKPLALNQNQPTAAPSVREPRAWEAAVDFEGLLVGELLRQMRGTPGARGLLPRGSGEKVFWNQYCQALGEDIARSTPLGIAEMIYRALDSGLKGGGDAHSTREQPPVAAPDSASS